MATSGDSAALRQLPQPFSILSRKLKKGQRRHTTNTLGSVQKLAKGSDTLGSVQKLAKGSDTLGSVQVLAKGFTVDAGMLSRHDSVDYGDTVYVKDTSVDDKDMSVDVKEMSVDVKDMSVDIQDKSVDVKEAPMDYGEKVEVKETEATENQVSFVWFLAHLS